LSDSRHNYTTDCCIQLSDSRHNYTTVCCTQLTLGTNTLQSAAQKCMTVGTITLQSATHKCMTVGTITLQSAAHNHQHFTGAFCSIHRPQEYGDITLLWRGHAAVHLDKVLTVRFPIVSLEYFIAAFRPTYGPGSAQPVTEMRPGIFPGGLRRPVLRLTTLPLLRADCWKIWKCQLP
jgi:hypothetical protein